MPDLALYDTHAHLDDPQFGGDVGAVVEAARQDGVRRILTVATTAASSVRCVALANQFEEVFAAVGIHPNHCHEATDDDWRQVVELASEPNVVAIGETGLDGHWNYAPMDLQRQYFDRHIELARATGLPFVVHMRDCPTEMEGALAAHAARGSLRGIMHSFSGDWTLASVCLDWGLTLSFSGSATFKKNGTLREIAARIPGDRILIETDAPYLSPEPMRKIRRNEPRLVRFTAECLAQARGQSLAQLAEETYANANRVLARL
jgi:TatD DNase family protein